MSVGNQATPGSINSSLTEYAVNLRNMCQGIADLQMFVVGLGLPGLEGLGYSAADAQTVLNMVSYMNTIAGVYFGTVQQGGSGGSGAILFNFQNALSQLTAGQ